MQVDRCKFNEEEDRNKLIIKIKKEYPDFLKNIKTEKTSTKELKDRLKEYNEVN